VFAKRIPIVALTLLAVSGCASAPTPEIQPIAPPIIPLGGAELDASLRATADEKWANIVAQWPDAVRPEVALIRPIIAPDYLPAQVRCMSDRGWPARMTSKRGAEIGLREGASELEFQVAKYECQVEYPLLPVQSGSALPGHDRYLYDLIVNAHLPCLRGLGVSYPAPPSFQEYLDSGGDYFIWDGLSLTWTASGALLTREEEERISDQCHTDGPEVEARYDELRPQYGL